MLQPIKLHCYEPLTPLIREIHQLSHLLDYRKEPKTPSKKEQVIYENTCKQLKGLNDFEGK